MIKFNNNNSEVTVKDIKFGNINMTKIITASKIIWEKAKDIVLGVFNSGKWISANIWNSNEIWKNL